MADHARVAQNTINDRGSRKQLQSIK